MTELGVVELRRYTLRPGARQTLVELFHRELVEPQEAVGLHVLATFADLDDADAFVWLRGFRDMETRKAGLEAFYGGPVWAEHADAANATMLDSDDVLLLRPDGRLGALDGRDGIVAATVCPVLPGAADAVADRFAQDLEPVLAAAGADVVARLRSEHSPNTFPALPIREGEDVFVWLARFDDEAAYARSTGAVERDPRWAAFTRLLERAPDVLRLALDQPAGEREQLRSL